MREELANPVRLRDGKNGPPGLAPQAAQLLASTPPFTTAPGRRARNWRRIEERVSTPARPWLLRPAMATAFVIIAASASAAVLSRVWRRPAPAVTPQPAATTARPVLSPLPTTIEPAVAPAPAEPAPTSAPRPRARAAKRAASAVPSAPESALLLEAIRALRREHTPERARARALTYLAKYPDGVLAEDALAVLVEAEAALSKERARRAGQRYLARYPNGRFRAQVEALIAR